MTSLRERGGDIRSGAALGLMLGLAAALMPGRADAQAPDHVQALTAAYNETGQKLFRALAAAPGNIVLSPYSIGTAMAMALSGARGGNAAEMAAALGHRLPPEQVAAANAEALALLERSAQGSDPKATAQLRIANALMLTKLGGESIAPDYAALVREKYAAEVFSNADLAQVNDWVKQKTDGRIESLLDRLDPNAIAVLLNAVAFKGPWQTPFDPQATRDAPFHAPAGEVSVPTMQLRGTFALAARTGYRAIRLPYAAEQLAMVVALPDDGAQTDEVAARLDGTEVAQLLAALRTQPQLVDLALPRFAARYKANLVAPFQQLGMRKAFDTHEADFSGMTGKPPGEVLVAIDQIEHRAVIDVGEEGTEAAAATGVVMGLRSVRPSAAETFRVDRPFLFYVVDDASGAILFQGRITDPRAAR
jgi:serpin B